MSLATAVVLSAVLPILSVSGGGHQLSLTPLTIVHYGVILWATIRLSILVARGEPRLLTFVFWLFTYLWFGLAPFAQLTLGLAPLPASFNVAIETTASAIVVIGLAAFEVGQVASRAFTSSLIGRGGERRDFGWGAVGILFLMTLVLLPVLINVFGGLSVFLLSRQAVGEAAAQLQPGSDGESIQAIYSALLSIPPLLGAAACFHLLRTASQRPPRLVVGALLFVFLVADAIVNNPISQSRAWFAVVVFMLIGSTTWAFSRSGFPLFAVTVIVSVVVIFPFAGYFRYTGPSALGGLDTVVNQYSISGDYDAYEQIAAGVDYVNVYGFDYGAHLLGPPLFWVPRSIWPDKPMDTGVVLATYEGYSYTNLSAPLGIETYISGGYLLVFGCFVVLGFLWRRLDDSFALSTPMGGGVVRLIVPAIAMYQTTVLRGSLLTATGRLVLLVTIPLLMTFVPRRRDR